MFFRRKEVDAAAKAPVAAAESATPVLEPRRGSAAADNSVLLDAIGGVLAALARYPVDLPHRPADATSKELTAWQRHATLGVAISGDDGSSVGIQDRDWRGLIRAVSELRRDEQGSVDSLVSELRGALWTCVSAVHAAVRIDDSAEAETGTHLTLLKKAMNGSQLNVIRTEVLRAVSEIDRTLTERREAQQAQFSMLATSLDALGKQLEEAKKESTTDPMTGVGNRKRFDSMAQRAIQLSALGRAPVTLLIVDLNKLKIINDSYGHTAGDAAISSVAQALGSVFQRQSDVVTRYGGDEFAVILNNCNVEAAEALALRLVERVRSLPRVHEAMEFALGVSIGIAELAAGEDVVAWIARADGAMYQAKRQPMGGAVTADATNAMKPALARTA